MTGYNLPPGCNVSDIPGNRPEDEAWEKLEAGFWATQTEDVWDTFDKAGLADRLMDVVREAIEYGMEIGRQEE